MIKNIRIVDNPKYIMVTKPDRVSGNVYHYHVIKINPINKYRDDGVWRIKSKKAANK